MRSRLTGESRIWYVLGAAALLVGLLMRLDLARAAETPGHGDSAFYYTVARNIAEGRGVVVDYVVYFFLGLVPITHYAGDFWNPLAEILISLPMAALGPSVFNALLASIVAGIVPAMVGFVAGRDFAHSTAAGVLVGTLTFFSTFMVSESVRTEAIIFFGAFGSLALLFTARGRSRARYFLLAAMCTGLAHFVRQDAILVLVTLVACILIAPTTWPRRLALAASAVAIHALIISPMLIRNAVAYGSPLQPGPSSTMFMTSYEDFHAYGKDMTWETMRAEWGIRGIVNRRLHAAGENLANFKYFLDPPLLYVASLGFVGMILTRTQPRRWHILVPPAIFFVLIFGFYTLLVMFSGPGSFPKSLAVLIPFICIAAVDLFAARIRSWLIVALAVFSVAGYLGDRGYNRNYWGAVYYNQIYAHYRTVRSIIEADAASRGMDPDSIVVMARDVWDVYEGTGFKAVMIPNNDLPTIFFVADHYGVNYMLLPAPRPALEDVYLGTTPEPRLVPIADIRGTDWKILRVEPRTE